MQSKSPVKRQLPKVEFDSGEKESSSPIRKYHFLVLTVGMIGFGSLYGIIVYGVDNRMWSAPSWLVWIPSAMLIGSVAISFAMMIYDIKRRDDVALGMIVFALIFYLGLFFALPCVSMWYMPDKRDVTSEIMMILRQSEIENRLQAELPEIKESTHFLFFTDSPSRITGKQIDEIESRYALIASDLQLPLPEYKVRIYFPARDVRYGVNRASIYASKFEDIDGYLVQSVLYFSIGYNPVRLLYDGVSKAFVRNVDSIHEKARDILMTGVAPILSNLISYSGWKGLSDAETDKARSLSASFVKFIMDEHGLDKFKQLFDEAGEVSFKRKFEKIYGMEFRIAEKKWLTFIVSNYCNAPLEEALSKAWLDLQLLKIDAYYGDIEENSQVYVNLGMPPERKWRVLRSIEADQSDEIRSRYSVPSDDEIFRRRFGEFRETRWRKYRGKVIDGIISFKVKDNSNGYAFVYCVSDVARQAHIWFTCRGRAAVYVSGRKVLEASGSDLVLDSHSARIDLSAGKNPILVEASPHEDFAFILRVADENGNRIDGITFQPPSD